MQNTHKHTECSEKCYTEECSQALINPAFFNVVYQGQVPSHNTLKLWCEHPTEIRIVISTPISSPSLVGFIFEKCVGFADDVGF